jgi:hypothetical protein
VIWRPSGEQGSGDRYPPIVDSRRQLQAKAAKPTLQIIIASTRPGRVGPSVAAWLYDRAVKAGDFDVELIDLAEVNLPLFDEPKHPRFGEYVHPHTRD